MMNRAYGVSLTVIALASMTAGMAHAAESGSGSIEPAASVPSGAAPAVNPAVVGNEAAPLGAHYELRSLKGLWVAGLVTDLGVWALRAGITVAFAARIGRARTVAARPMSSAPLCRCSERG